MKRGDLSAIAKKGFSIVVHSSTSGAMFWIDPSAKVDSNRFRSLVQTVMKLNSGRENENVKHPADLVEALNDMVLPNKRDLHLLYASSMF